MEQFFSLCTRTDGSPQTRRRAANSHLPWCSGVTQVDNDDLGLFYKHGDNTSFISLVDPSKAQLDYLFQACQPATFGLGQQDVLDESYRKAGKLDTSQFALNFSPGNLISIIKSQLGENERRDIRTELYKLNVYGENSFFKKHKDTPRSKNMFGSLVIVLPLAHTGGKLNLSHGNHTFAFDSSALLSDKQRPTVAYVAFYSHVEHEVEKVTSGHRITLTYNFHFVDEISEAAKVTVDDASNLIQQALSNVLSSGTPRPNIAFLGFGLQHEYPIGTNTKPESLKPYLKGGDAAVLRACNALSLDVSLKFVDDVGDYESQTYLIDHIPSWGQDEVEDPTWRFSQEGGILVWPEARDYDIARVEWVVKRTKNTSIKPSTLRTVTNLR